MAVLKRNYNFVIGDESSMYAHEPETKAPSTLWVFQDKANPTKVFDLEVL